jgi:hypothetical protein
LVGFALTAVAAASLGVVAFRIVPRARRTAAADAKNRAELQLLGEEALNPKQAQSKESDAAAGHAKSAEENARKFADRLALLDPIAGGGGADDRARLVQELAAKTGKPAVELEALLPPASMPAAVANDRIGTIGDLALAAFDAGVGDLIYVVFPDEPASASKEIFGEWLPTRPVKLEYKATYAAHRAFLQGLLRRRDRGPFYTVDSIDVARPSALRRAKSDDPAAGDGADTNYRAESSEILVAKVTLRRILPSSR